MSTALSYAPVVRTGAPSPPLLRHLDGAAVRAAICEGHHFKPVPVPGSARPEAPARVQLDRRLWCLPGVYCLLTDPKPTQLTDTYVGSSGDLVQRLITHHKTGWTHAILLTGHGIGSAGAAQAESGIGRVLKARGPSKHLTPTWSRHPAPWGADMPWFLFEPLVVLLDLCLTELLTISVDLDPSVARL